MTALFRCDGCDGIMPDDAPRIAIEIVNEPEKPTERTDDEMPMFGEMLVSVQSFGFVGSHHFCKMGCLSAWAMGRAIEDAA